MKPISGPLQFLGENSQIKLYTNLNLHHDLVNIVGHLSVGCSDSAVYSGEWKIENYIVVSLLGVIAALILVGTLLDCQGTKERDGIWYQIVKAFSLKENIKFIFQTPKKGGSGRFECLEGMRSIRKVPRILLGLLKS